MNQSANQIYISKVCSELYVNKYKVKLAFIYTLISFNTSVLK